MSRSLDFDDGFTSSNPSTANTLPASDVTVTPSGNLSSDDVQSALVELQTEIDTLSTSAELAAHAADSTDVHGVTGSVVGTEGAQTLSSKTLASPVVTGNLDASAATTVSAGTSNSPTTVNIGTGSGGNTINIGGPGATVVLAGTTITENATNSDVQDKLITINKGGAAASAGGTGFEIEENNVITGYSKTSGDRNSFEFKAPNTNGVATLTPGASADSIVLAAATQTLSGKSFSDAVILPEIATPSTPSSGNGKIYFKSDGFLYQLNDDGTESKVGSGSGGGGINYIADTDAEAVANSWTTYADAAGAQPVNGTAGSPTVTWTRTTSNPLRGTASFLFTKDAANRQGEGASYDFTISAADKAKVLTISFDHIVASGTFVAGNPLDKSPVGDSDLTVWIYDVTNSLLIQPSTYRLYSNSSSIADAFSATFQSSSNSTSYRLIVHCATTSASAYTVAFDNIKVGPSQYSFGTPVTDYTSYTSTIAGFGTVGSPRYIWRRVGDSLQLKGYFTVGTSTATTASLTIPSGISIDYTKLTTAAGQAVGVANKTPNAAAAIWTSGQGLILFTDGSDTGKLYFAYQGSGNVIQKVDGNIIGASGENVSFYAEVPVVGWSSSVQMSDSADTRVVAVRAANATNSTINTTATKIPFATVTHDTHAAWNTNGTFTAPAAGYYRVALMLTTTALTSADDSNGRTLDVALYKNGAQYSLIAQNRNTRSSVSHYYEVTGSDTVYLKSGDTLEIYATNSLTGSSTTLIGAADYCHIAIERIGGTPAITSIETIAARYSGVNTTTFTTSGVVADYNGKSFDTHSAVTTGASWKFTAPVAGIYSVTAAFYPGNANGLILNLRKNGTSVVRLCEYVASASGKINTGATTIQLNAGDYIDLIGFSGSLTTTFANDATLNYIDIYKVK